MSATLVESEHRAVGLNAGADAYLTDAVNPSEFIATIRALLRARNAERHLRETERRFELLVRSVEEHAIYTCDASGIITSWNEGVRRIFGYDSDQFIGRPYAFAFASQAEANQDLETARREGRLAYDRWHEREGGMRFFATGTVTAIQDDLGEVIGFVNVVRDVTVRQQVEEERASLLAAEHSAREEAERINRLKDEFLATLSHELRTPLSAILGWTQLLQTDLLSAAERREGIEVIDRNARAQAQLIEDLLDVSRIISGKLRLNVERFDLAKLVAAAVESVQTATDAKRIHVTVDCDPEAGALTGDPNRVQQILWNLLSNAVKFTSEGGAIDVSTKKKGHEIEISVADNGQGIDPQFLPYVFDRFRQADASTTRSQGGLGLGLAIVRHLTELHGGIVHARSEGKGTGSVFRICLPVVSAIAEGDLLPESPSRVAHRPPTADRTTDLTGISLLIVEDQSDTRDLLCRILSRSGADVRVAASAADGVASFAERRPDVLLSDIGMPGEDGYACLRRIRELEASRNSEPVPAIALTAFAQAEDRGRALQAGFRVHISKPVIPSELVAVIGGLCGRSAGAGEGEGRRPEHG
jgi:PAS domain S-box-containing protein